MTLEVLGAGPMLSVQDHGRHGRKRFGVPAAGAMDRPAMDLANALCGNPPGTAALEFAAVGGSFRTHRSLRLAVTGATATSVSANAGSPPGRATRSNPARW